MNPIRTHLNYIGPAYSDVSVTFDNGLTRDVINKKPVVHVLAVAGQKGILLTREFRAGLGKIVVGLPAGHIEEGESAELAGIRELQEETGYRPCDVTPLIGSGLTSTPLTATPLAASAGWTNELKSLIIGSELVLDPLPSDEDENIEVFYVTPDEAVRMALEGEIEELAAVTAILAARVRGWI